MTMTMVQVAVAVRWLLVYISINSVTSSMTVVNSVFHYTVYFRKQYDGYVHYDDWGWLDIYIRITLCFPSSL